MYNLDLEKGEEPEIKLPTSVGSQKKQENSRKTPTSVFIDYAKAFDCVDQNKVWKIFKEMEMPEQLKFPDSSVGKEFTYNAGDSDSIPELGRSTAEGIGYPFQYYWASLVAQLVKNQPAMWETWDLWVGKIP